MKTNTTRNRRTALAVCVFGLAIHATQAAATDQSEELHVLQTVLTADDRAVYLVEYLPAPTDAFSISNGTAVPFEITDTATGARHSVPDSATLSWSCEGGDGFQATVLEIAPAEGGIPVQIEMLCGSTLKVMAAAN